MWLASLGAGGLGGRVEEEEGEGYSAHLALGGPGPSGPVPSLSPSSTGPSLLFLSQVPRPPAPRPSHLLFPLPGLFVLTILKPPPGLCQKSPPQRSPP